jgi:integrase
MAEERLREILTDAQRGLLPESNATGARFTDASLEYLRYVENVSQVDPVTLKDYRGVIDGYLTDEFGSKAIETITPDDIDRYKERLLSEGRLSNRTIVRHLTVLHGIFKRATRVWGLGINPASASLVERPKVVYTGEFHTYDRDEVELLASHAADDQDATIYRTAAYTGLRQGELLALRWTDVDLIDGLLHVRRNFSGGVEKIPKGKKVRSVPMVPEVIDSFAKLKDRGNFTGDEDLVFCNEVGEHLTPDALRRRYWKAQKAAELRPLRFHDLRHAFGSAAITRLDPTAVQAYMGHRHYSTTQRYLHHRPRRQDAAALADAFRGEDETLSRTAEKQANQEKQPAS